MQRPVRDGAASSGARHWAPLARFIEAEARIGAWAEQRTATLVLYEFVRFGIKQGWACLFGALMLALVNRPQAMPAAEAGKKDRVRRAAEAQQSIDRAPASGG